jgi:hypothetical protein
METNLLAPVKTTAEYDLLKQKETSCTHNNTAVREEEKKL